MSYKSSTGRNIGKPLIIFQSDRSILGQGVGQGVGPGIAATLPITATGGNTVLTPGDGWKYHIFTSPGSFSVTNAGPESVELILVGGGGGGGGADLGGSHGGGGGAGGVFYRPVPITTSPGSYSLTIGGGGTRGEGAPEPSPNNGTSGSSGTPTTGFGFTAFGGGGGGRYGGGGGSCGPGGNTTPRPANAISPPVGWGFPSAPDQKGGGAGGVSPISSTPSIGLIISNFYLSQGGGSPYAPTSGAANGLDYSSGNGGGGGKAPGGSGGAGGSGIAIIRYKNIIA